MKKILALFGAMLFIGITGCTIKTENTNQEATGKEAEPTKAIANKCTYSVNNATAKLYWTAYKHTQKVEVKGIMDSIVLTNTTKDENILSAIKGTSFSIFTNSVNSNDEGRDKKIRENFFGNMEGTDIISGSIIELNNDTQAQIELTLNGQTVTLPATLTVNDDIIQLRCEVNFNKWETTKALSELNKACEEKHTGIDGKSIFWPQAKILVEVNAIKECL